MLALLLHDHDMLTSGDPLHILPDSDVSLTAPWQ